MLAYICSMLSGCVLVKRKIRGRGRHVSLTAFNQGRACESNGRSES